jgi:hypothetical protein
MNRASIAAGLDGFVASYGTEFRVLEQTCPDERWLRWLTRAAAGIPICS